jgi:hypothetical protein
MYQYSTAAHHPTKIEVLQPSFDYLPLLLLLFVVAAAAL